MSEQNIIERIESLENRDYIIDSGSNENGDWIKYDNGIMICWKNVEGNQFACTQKAENGFYYTDIDQAEENTKTWNFPFEFIDIPTVNVSVESNAYSSASVGYKTKSTVIVYCVLPYPVATTKFKWNLTAKGHWK